MLDSRKLMVWLDCLHYNYLDNKLGLMLSSLNPNNPSDLDEIIRLVFEREFSEAIGAGNELALKEMKESLDEVDLYPESEVREMFEEVDLPFKEPIQDHRAFFRRVREYFYS